MNDTKITPIIAGSLISWLLAVLSYFVQHSTQLAGMAAIVASVFTAMAAFEKWRLCRRQRKELDKL